MLKDMPPPPDWPPPPRLMSKEGIKSIIDDCSRRVPPKHTAYLEYFKSLTLAAEEENSDQNKIGARLWLALLRPNSVPSLIDVPWTFQMDEQLLSILQKLTSRGFIGAGDVIDVTLQSAEGEMSDLLTFDIITETLSTISKTFNAHNASSSAELKLIQFLLTASTNPNRAISGDLLAVALNKLAEVFLHSKQTVNQNAARAAITQLVSERMDIPPSASKSFRDQELLFKWLCEVIRSTNCPPTLTNLGLDLIHSSIKLHTEMFIEGELRNCINDDLLPTLVGPIGLDKDGTYERSLRVLGVLFWPLFKVNKEFIEMVSSEYFGRPLSFFSSKNGGNQSTGPLIKSHLITLKNKLLTIVFIKKHIFEDPAHLFDCFVNFDNDRNSFSLIEDVLELLYIFANVDWHCTEGVRITGSTLSDKSLSLKLACIDALQSLIRSINSWRSMNDLQLQEESITKHSKVSSTKRALKACIQMFNTKPQLGLDLMIKSGFAERGLMRCQARWLRSTRGLCKKAIGELLGAASNRELLTAYTESFDFNGMSFATSLRTFLESFRIPGESQIIERFLEEFSRKLHETSPDVFEDVDMLFQISYSTLMLNTDMYSSNVREKMSREGFIKNTKGAIEDKSLSDDVLHGIYDEIASKEIQLHCQYIDQPLPVGLRDLDPYAKCSEGGYLTPFLIAYVDQIAQTLALLIDKLEVLPATVELSLSDSRLEVQSELINELLNNYRDVTKLTCELGLDKERYCVLERVLGTRIFQPNYQSYTGSTNPPSLLWLYEICGDLGSNLGSSWHVVLSCLSNWDIASVVDENHNIRELNLTGLDGEGLLSLMGALFRVKKESVTRRTFIQHYVDRLYQLPSSQLEKILRYSYDREKQHSPEGFFSILSHSATDPLLATTAFGIIQRIAREHMPLILSLSDEVMFGYLRALERFGQQPVEGMGSDAIDTLILIGELLCSHHRQGDKMAPVSDEEFFLKWYHVLSSLSRIAAEQQVKAIRATALQSLFKLLNDQGACYGEGAWKVIWRSVIFPLLEELTTPGADLDLFCSLMESSVAIICSYNTVLIAGSISDIFENVLKMLEGMSMALRSVELYQFGLKLIQQLIQSNHSSCFTPRHWTMIVDTFDRIYTSYLPGDLSTLVTAVENQQVLEKSDSRLGRAAPHFDLSMSATSISAIDYYRRPNVSKDDDDDDEDIGILNALSEKCHAQLQLVEVFSILAVKLPNGQESIFSPISTITIDALQKFLDLLLSLYEFSVKFNSNVPLRELMTQAKFAESFEQLKLTRQETTSLGLLVELTFDFYKRALLIRDQLPCLKDDRAASYDMGMRYFEISTTILRRYIEMRLPDASPKRIGKSWTLLASTVLRQWMQLMEIISKRDKSIPKDLLNITEVKVGMLVEIALELYPLVESNHHLREQSHEFILNTTKQLIEYRRNVM